MYIRFSPRCLPSTKLKEDTGHLSEDTMRVGEILRIIMAVVAVVAVPKLHLDACNLDIVGLVRGR